MAVMRSKEVPKDAVVLEEMEAVTYAWDIVRRWDSLAESWALLYGPGILGGVNALSGLYVNNFYRHKFKLGPYGFFSSVIPITIIPTLFTMIIHRHLVSTDILLMKRACPVCYEVRAATIQGSMGTAYPMLLGPTAAMMLANRYGTMRLPDLVEGPKVVLSFIKKSSKPLLASLPYLLAIQIIASTVVTHFELKNHFMIRSHILEVEKKLESEESI